MVSVALSQLKRRLQHDYQQAYPDSGDLIHLVLDEEEARAREISFFPHLILPDLAEAHIAKLGLQPSPTRDAAAGLPHGFTKTELSKIAFALCG
jgi:hypothetical protein